MANLHVNIFFFDINAVSLLCEPTTTYILVAPHPPVLLPSQEAPPAAALPNSVDDNCLNSTKPKIASLQQQNNSLRTNLAALKKQDPAELSRKTRLIPFVKDAVNRWGYNIETVKRSSWSHGIGLIITSGVSAEAVNEHMSGGHAHVMHMSCTCRAHVMHMPCTCHAHVVHMHEHDHHDVAYTDGIRCSTHKHAARVTKSGDFLWESWEV